MIEVCCTKSTHSEPVSQFHWRDGSVWKQSAINTSWCLLGCSIGDFGAIFAYQVFAPQAAVWLVMTTAIICGILTSIALETVILSRQMNLNAAFKMAIGMSLISMIAMEIAMNLIDLWLVGGARIVWWALLPMLIAGFLTPWPYNYWRLKKLGKACH